MSLIRGNALAVPLAGESVDLVCTSPPYFALRSYTDGGEHYDGQIGSEATPAEFVAALLEVTRECVRVLKPSGSLWVNLGDKYAGNGPSNAKRGHVGKRRTMVGVDTTAGHRPKSLLGLPWRYALGCIDDLGLILRAEVIWSKPNGLPESVQDRVRRSHEQWFHFTKEPRYFSAVDEIREGYAPASLASYARGGLAASVGDATHPSKQNGNRQRNDGDEADWTGNPLGKLPGSVWTVPTEPLRVPDHLPQHFAAFPSEWPKRIILGWSPSGVCVECGEGRRPVTERLASGRSRVGTAGLDPSWQAINRAEWSEGVTRTIVGESCACPTPDAPTRPAVVLDPFAGTGTTVAVANALGRHGIGLDLSADYLKLARWRCQDPGLRAKVLGVDKPKPETAGQLDLLGTAS